jgi:hypothetical protein
VTMEGRLPGRSAVPVGCKNSVACSNWRLAAGSHLCTRSSPVMSIPAIYAKTSKTKVSGTNPDPFAGFGPDFCHSVRLARSPAHRGAPLCFRLRGASADDVVVLHRPESGGGSGRDADLRVDVLDVVVGGLGGDDESVGDLAGREATRGELEHVDLSA